MSCKKNVGWPERLTQLGLGLILCSAVMLFSQQPAGAGQSVLLAWIPSSSPDIAGYKIHFGTACHQYDQTVDVGNVTNATIALPCVGATYYFAATAYDVSGVESDFSNESTYTVPTAVTLTAPSLSAGQFSFTVAGTSGANCVIEASTNLIDWWPVQTNTPPFQFVDMKTAGVSRCFYRAVHL